MCGGRELGIVGGFSLSPCHSLHLPRPLGPHRGYSRMVRDLAMRSFPGSLLDSPCLCYYKDGAPSPSSLCEWSCHILWDFSLFLSFTGLTGAGAGICVRAHEYGSFLKGSRLGMGQAYVGVLEDPLGRLLTGCEPHLRPGPLPNPHKHTPDFAQTQLCFYLC